MKFFVKIFFVLIILSIFYAPSALAYKSANFPDSTKLQPMPENVVPNISENINSEPRPDLAGQDPLELDLLPSGQPANSDLNKNIPASKNNQKSFNYFLLVVAVIFVVISFVYMAIKNKWFQKAE